MASGAQTRRMALLAVIAALVGGGALLALVGQWSPPPGDDDAVLPPNRAAVPEQLAKPAPDAVILAGRCVDARTLSPIAGCTIRMYGIDLADLGQRHPAWRLEPARSDDDGRFRLELTPPPGLSYRLTTVADGYADARRSPTLTLGTEEDLGDIPLRRGVKLTGRVVDTTGTPRAGVRVGLGHYEGDDSSWQTSGSDGTFSPGYLLPGSWNLALAADEETIALRSPMTLEIPDDGSDTEVTVVLFADGELPVNEGIVVDEDGQPIPDARVLRGVVTDDQGRFRHPTAPTNYLARSGFRTYHPTARGYEADQFSARHAVGARSIILRMHRAPPVTLAVTVVDEVSEEPVEAFDAVCLGPSHDPDASQNPGWHVVAKSFGPHPGGRTHLDDVTPGERLILVHPLGERSALVHATRITSPAEGESLVVRLPRPAERVLEAISPSGDPIVDSLVEVLLGFDDRPLSMSSQAFRSWKPLRMVQHAVILHTARTDGEGRVVLRGPPGRALCVRIVGRGHAPEVLSGIRLDGPPLRITVRPGGTITGRVPTALLEGLRTVGLSPEHGPRERLIRSGPAWPQAFDYALDSDPRACGLRLRSRFDALPSWSHLFPIGTDGEFLVAGVEPGEWDVRLRVPSRHYSGAWLALGSVALRDGEVRRLELDLVRLEPGTLSGTLQCDGQPLPHRILGFAPSELWMPKMLETPWIACETDAQGRFAIRLLAGRWRPAVIGRSVAAPYATPWVSLPGEIEVRPGTPTAADFAFTRRRLTVHVLDAAREPRRYLRLRVAIGTDAVVHVLTDHDGRLVIDPLIGDTPVARISDDDHGHASLRVPAKPRDPELTVVLR